MKLLTYLNGNTVRYTLPFAALNDTALELMLLLCSDALRQTAPYMPNGSAVFTVKRYIEHHYMEQLSLELLASEVHISPDHLIRLFRRETGTTPGSYISEIRLRNARRLLESTDLKINEIAQACGYSDAAYFISRFRHFFCATPAGYRDSLR